MGLVNAPVWNERTGNLVSGHQRLAIIDSLERSQNYMVTVDAVDVDLKTEKEMNIFLNNISAMGSWDDELLTACIDDLGLDSWEELGFEKIEMDYFSGKGVFDKDQNRTIDPEVSKIGEIKEARKKIREGNQKVDDAGFYAIVVFQDREGVERWITAMGYPPGERYLDGKVIEEKTRPQIATVFPKQEMVQPGEGS